MNPPKPLRIAIIQLTRIGDLIQTTQAVRQFRAENPETKITLIARKKFATGIQFLLETVFDDIVLFDTKDLLDKSGLKQSQILTNKFIQELNGRSFDVSVNLSFNKSSSYLNSLINCELRLGIHRNRQNQISINDNWSKYVYSNVMNSANNPFNLVDIFRYILGSHELLTLDPIKDNVRDKKIVLHPFASHKKKKWGLNKWSELIFKLIKDNPEHTVHIVGGAEDANDSQRLINSPALTDIKTKIKLHAGTDNIADTYQLLMGSEIFIGHDSMVSHIAAETLTPSVIISLGTVRPTETNAYQAQVINISPRMKCFPCQVEASCETLPCHNSINHQAVAIVAKGLLESKVINQEFLNASVSPFQLDTIRVYSSDYHHTGLYLEEVSANYKTINDVFRDFYKIIWQCYLRDTDLNLSLPEISQKTAAELYRYQDGVNYLYEIYNFGVKFSNKIITEAEKPEPNINLIRENLDKLTELDGLCAITKKSYPMLTGLVDYFYVHKANTPGNNIIEVSKNNLIAYYDASNLTAVLYEFLDKSVSPHIEITKSLEV